MTTVGELYRAVDEIAPFRLTDSFDNTGLLVGNAEAPVARALLALDITRAVVAEAREADAQLIISHHPVIFHPLKSLCGDDPAGMLLVSGIAAICAHTNLDRAQGGLSDEMARLLELRVLSVLSPMAGEPSCGYGRICEVEGEPTAALLAQRAKEAFGCAVVRYVEGSRPIRRIAVVSGSGGSELPAVLEQGVDAFITGDVKHDQWITAANEGLTLIDAGHFHTEAVFAAPLMEKLAARYPDVEFRIARGNADPCGYVI